MNKVVSIIALLVILIFIGVFTGYIMDNDGHLNPDDAKLFGITYENETSLTLYSDTPINRSILLDELKNGVNNEGYDINTVLWIESLNEREVFISDVGYVIMNQNDANKISTTFNTDMMSTDTYYEYYIDCIIVENRSLGGNGHKNVLLVKDVKYLGNHTFYYEV